MPLTLFQVDAFSDRPFRGNPAAVVPLTEWLPESLMQAIAEENNLAETAFFVPAAQASEADFALRWFTPLSEVDLCGHATLASAAVLFGQLGFLETQVRFQTRSGVLTVERVPTGLRMLLPATVPAPAQPAPAGVEEALGIAPLELWAGYDLLALLPSEEAVRTARPDLALVAKLPYRGVILTAASGAEDDHFVSRFFAPALGVPEDPVTGSAHCQLVPFWSTRLGVRTLRARQLSRRGGSLLCEWVGDQVALTGWAALYLKGELTLPAEG